MTHARRLWFQGTVAHCRVFTGGAVPIGDNHKHRFQVRETSMPEAHPHAWPLILAAGEGTRLRALTTKPCGTAVPKQFCSLKGGHSLLEDAITRAQRLATPDRICAVLAEQHRRWWAEGRLTSLPARNLIVQPRNRGTGIGILYSVLHILPRDPHARLVLLPADHAVRDEAVLSRSLGDALRRLERNTASVTLLGVEPEEADTELGYILPAGRDPSGGERIACFVEKPSSALAAEIMRAGGLWNTFIIVATAQGVLDLFMKRHAALAMQVQVAVTQALNARTPAAGWPALVNLYDRLPALDFSRDLLQGQEHELSMARLEACGWSDLGTPRRVGQTLRRLAAHSEPPAAPARDAPIDLAAQHAHFERPQVSLRA